MQEWQTYLLKRRQFLIDQLRYVSSQSSRLEEIANDERTDVSGDWLEMTRTEYVQVTQLLFDAGLLIVTQADQSQPDPFPPTEHLRRSGRRVTAILRAAEITQELCTPLWVQIPLADADISPDCGTQFETLELCAQR